MDGDIKEQPRPEIIWKYEQLQESIYRSVNHRTDIPFSQLPDKIDLGLLGYATNSLAQTSAVGGNDTEWAIQIGVDRTNPHKLYFSEAVKGTEPSVTIDPADLPIIESVAGKLGLGAVTHSHPGPLILSPQDLFRVRDVVSFVPVMGLGTTDFKMLAVRSDQTDFILSPDDAKDQQIVDQKHKQETVRILKKYPVEFSQYFKIFPLHSPRHLTSLSEAELNTLNSLYDVILRAEAAEHHIGLYISSLVNNTVTRCVLNKPILSQNH